jgi:gas vesicle protein
MEHKKNQESGLLYMFAGMAVGAVLGLLLAPKKGSELREDIGELGREGREKGRELVDRLSSMVPFRVKAAAAVGAVKAGGAEAIREVKEKVILDGASK